MKDRQKLLSDEQWELIEPLMPLPKRRPDQRGRPWARNRDCFEGILWILQTGAAWRFLPAIISFANANGSQRPVTFLLLGNPNDARKAL